MPSVFGAVFPHQLCHPNAVVRKNRLPPLGLRGLMKDVLLPVADSLFVPPPGERENFAVGGQALETFDIDKTVNIRQQGFKFGRELQVARLMRRRGWLRK